MKILVTGGAGFIGSNFIRYLMDSESVEVCNLDSLTYAGNLENLAEYDKRPGYQFCRGDICDEELVDNLMGQGVDAVINFAAESHVDRSIEDSTPFLRTNIQGVQNLLEGARRHSIQRFIQVSTDEVYGSLGSTGAFSEESPLSPNSPYAASKAGADLLVHAYYQTYNVPAIITRCSNNYGPFQFPEKLIPLFITNAMADNPLPLYGDGLYVRDWIHVMDHCRALHSVLQKGKEGEAYNIGASTEKANLKVAENILEILDKPRSLLTFVEDRPGHDRRYAIDSSKLRNDLGWTPEVTFEEGIEKTVQWYLDNKNWWERIKSGEYKAYYDRMYQKRLEKGTKQ